MACPSRWTRAGEAFEGGEDNAIKQRQALPQGIKQFPGNAHLVLIIQPPVCAPRSRAQAIWQSSRVKYSQWHDVEHVMASLEIEIETIAATNNNTQLAPGVFCGRTMNYLRNCSYSTCFSAGVKRFAAKFMAFSGSSN